MESGVHSPVASAAAARGEFYRELSKRNERRARIARLVEAQRGRHLRAERVIEVQRERRSRAASEP